MGGGGAVLTGVRGCEDGWETLGRDCEKTQWEITVGNKTKEKNPGKNTGECRAKSYRFLHAKCLFTLEL